MVFPQRKWSLLSLLWSEKSQKRTRPLYWRLWSSTQETGRRQRNSWRMYGSSLTRLKVRCRFCGHRVLPHLRYHKGNGGGGDRGLWRKWNSLRCLMIRWYRIQDERVKTAQGRKTTRFMVICIARPTGDMIRPSTMGGWDQEYRD